MLRRTLRISRFFFCGFLLLGIVLLLAAVFYPAAPRRAAIRIFFMEIPP